jgi:hypothetical protein
MVAMVIEYCIAQGAPRVRHGVKYAKANPNFTNEGKAVGSIGVQQKGTAFRKARPQMDASERGGSTFYCCVRQMLIPSCLV